MSKPFRRTAGTAVTTAVLELGKKLVVELGIDNSVDTLGRWMAHYVSQLIADAKAAKPSQRAASEARCAAAVLELWRHRYTLQYRRDVFESEPLLRAVASLDPDSPHPRYFGSIREQAEGGDKKVSEWLRLADAIDSTARMLVVQCLGAAAAQAGDKAHEWITVAEAAAFVDDAPALAIRFVNAQRKLHEVVDPDDPKRELLADRLKRLKAFAKLAKMLENQLTRQIKAISVSRKRPTRQKKVGRRSQASKPRGLGGERVQKKAKTRRGKS